MVKKMIIYVCLVLEEVYERIYDITFILIDKIR